MASNQSKGKTTSHPTAKAKSNSKAKPKSKVTPKGKRGITSKSKESKTSTSAKPKPKPSKTSTSAKPKTKMSSKKPLVQNIHKSHLFPVMLWTEAGKHTSGPKPSEEAEKEAKRILRSKKNITKVSAAYNTSKTKREENDIKSHFKKYGRAKPSQLKTDGARQRLEVIRRAWLKLRDELRILLPGRAAVVDHFLGF